MTSYTTPFPFQSYKKKAVPRLNLDTASIIKINIAFTSSVALEQGEDTYPTCQSHKAHSEYLPR